MVLYGCKDSPCCGLRQRSGLLGISEGRYVVLSRYSIVLVYFFAYLAVCHAVLVVGGNICCLRSTSNIWWHYSMAFDILMYISYKIFQEPMAMHGHYTSVSKDGDEDGVATRI